jgi:hypothetical protein
MFYYLVEKIGDGTEGNSIRPNYVGSYVWGEDNVCPNCGTYIIGLPTQTEQLQPITDLETACNARSLSVNDVLKWFVGD